MPCRQLIVYEERLLAGNLMNHDPAMELLLAQSIGFIFIVWLLYTLMKHYFKDHLEYESMSFESIFKRHYELVAHLMEQQPTNIIKIKEANVAFEKEYIITEKLYYFFRRHKKYFTNHQFVSLARFLNMSIADVEGGSPNDFRDSTVHDRPEAHHFYCCRSLNHETLYIGIDAERKESVLPQRWGVVGRRQIFIYTSHRTCVFLATIFEDYVSDESESTWVYTGTSVQRFIAGKWLEHLGNIFDQFKLASDIEALKDKSSRREQDVSNFIQKSA